MKGREMSVGVSRRTAGFVIVGVVSLLVPAAADAQFAFSAYLGTSSTLDGKVELRQPGDTSLTFHDVSWYDESWVNPKYYGFRLSYWNRNAPRWGFVVDFTHAKMYAELDATVRVTGSREGEPVDGEELLGDTFDSLSISHGHNTLTINGFHRWISAGGARRLRPYVGFGIGIAVPHVEVEIGDSLTEEYQFAGPTLQGLGGVDFRIWNGLSVFAEYRLNYARLDTDLTGGGSLKVAPWTNHLSAGLTFTFR
jgi:lipid A oxidase